MPEYQMEKVSDTEVEVSVPSTEITRISLDQINEQIRFHTQLLINEQEEYERKVAYLTSEKAKMEAQRDSAIALGVKTAEEVKIEKDAEDAKEAKEARIEIDIAPPNIHPTPNL